MALFASFSIGLRAQRNPARGDGAFKKWLNEDVAYIITHEERDEFLQLGTDRQRREFVEQFWLRRNPTPDTAENKYKEEHYRRLAYANAHFASQIPGWKTDRGRIYIMDGPPDEIETHPGGAGKPGSELWRYRYVEGIGVNLTFGFTDRNGSGDYLLTSEPPPGRWTEALPRRQPTSSP